MYDTSLLPQANIVEPIPSKEEGYVRKIACDEIGICSLILGGGRETKESEIDLSVGIVLEKKVGDYVKAGEPLAYIYANDRQKMEQAKERFLGAYTISAQKTEEQLFIKGIVE